MYKILSSYGQLVEGSCNLKQDVGGSRCWNLLQSHSPWKVTKFDRGSVATWFGKSAYARCLRGPMSPIPLSSEKRVEFPLPIVQVVHISVSDHTFGDAMPHM